MIHLSDYLYEAELNLEWWNSKSPAYQKRYLAKHPNSIYSQKAKSGELDNPISKEKTSDNEVVITDKPQVADKYSKKKQQLEDRIKSDTEDLNKKYLEHRKLLDEYKAIPEPSSPAAYDYASHRYIYKNKLKNKSC